MAKPANYPDWVMKHKRKGTYINKVGDKYYLYAAHSERVKGTDKVRRVSDGYLGRITEKDGLIPPKDKLRSATIRALEFGFSYALISITEKVHAGLRRSFVKNGDLIYACSILNFMFGQYTNDFFNNSYLKLHFPGVEISEEFTDTQISGIQRGTRMISDYAEKIFGDDLEKIRQSFSLVRIVEINSRTYITSVPPEAKALADKYSIRWEDSLWQK